MNLTGRSKPQIKKLGTLLSGVVETTPFVFRDTLYRVEWARAYAAENTRKQNYLRIVNQETGQLVNEMGDLCMYPCAMVDGDTVYVVGTFEGNRRIEIFASKDLKNWQNWTLLDGDRYSCHNTSLCKTDDGYAVSFEIDLPVEEAGVFYTARFALSKDMKNWEITKPECVYSKDRYTAPHMLRYHDGWYYLFYLEAIADPKNGNRDGMRYEQCVVRSRDLVRWESSSLNPVLAASPEDKIIANSRLDSAHVEQIKGALDCNNSDIDVCEYRGQVIINYSWGDQTGIEFLATAVYDGTLPQFLTGWFEQK